MVSQPNLHSWRGCLCPRLSPRTQYSYHIVYLSKNNLISWLPTPSFARSSSLAGNLSRIDWWAFHVASYVGFMNVEYALFLFSCVFICATMLSWFASPQTLTQASGRRKDSSQPWQGGILRRSLFFSLSWQLQPPVLHKTSISSTSFCRLGCRLFFSSRTHFHCNDDTLIIIHWNARSGRDRTATPRRAAAIRPRVSRRQISASMAFGPTTTMVPIRLTVIPTTLTMLPRCLILSYSPPLLMILWWLEELGHSAEIMGQIWVSMQHIKEDFLLQTTWLPFLVFLLVQW